MFSNIIDIEELLAKSSEDEEWDDETISSFATDFDQRLDQLQISTDQSTLHHSIPHFQEAHVCVPFPIQDTTRCTNISHKMEGYKRCLHCIHCI